MANTVAQSRKRSGWMASAVAMFAVAMFVACERQADDADAAADSAAVAPDPDAGVMTVTLEELNTSARVVELRGQEVRIASVPVVSAMGTHLFWVELTGGAPFLIKLDSTLVASGMTAPSTGNYTILGRVLEKSPALLAEWQQSGVLRSEGDKMQAEFGTSYIEARRVAPAGT